MNSLDSSWCVTNQTDRFNYNIPVDSEGNNVITGEGYRYKNDKKRFTCLELEVFAVSF
jgi:hypothetical protein